MARKYGVTKLTKCKHCQLLFRMPNDKPNFNKTFYQDNYVQDDAITTQLPSEAELCTLIDQGFKGTGKEIDHLLKIFQTLFSDLKGVRILDFGASWGYMSYLFQRAGMNVQSFEIGEKRAQFGREKLGVDIQTDKRKLRDNNQIFFSSHVIEHVPSIKEMIEDAYRLTANNEPAYFIALCPNGSLERMKSDPNEYHQNWGLVHPNFISSDFYHHVFESKPYLIQSNPYDIEAIAKWDKKSHVKFNLTGGELLIIVRLN